MAFLIGGNKASIWQPNTSETMEVLLKRRREPQLVMDYREELKQCEAVIERGCFSAVSASRTSRHSSFTSGKRWWLLQRLMRRRYHPTHKLAAARVQRYPAASGSWMRRYSLRVP
jgi:hypothetical protein